MTGALQSLLPSNATPWALAVSETSAERFDALIAETDKLSTLWDPWTCPEAWLPYLARAVAVPVWDPAWPAERKRRVIARTPHWQHLRGTLPVIEEVVAEAGGRVVSALMPPLSPIVGARASAEEMRAWLDRLPQIRVTDAEAAGWTGIVGAPPYPLPPEPPAIAPGPAAGGVYATLAGHGVIITGAAPPGALVEVVIAGPGETFPDVADPREADPALTGAGWSTPWAVAGSAVVGDGPGRGSRAVLVRDGVETELVVLEEIGRPGVEVYALPQPAAASCSGMVVGALAAGDGERVPAARVRRADPSDLARHTSMLVLGALEAATAEPETEIAANSTPDVAAAGVSAIDRSVVGGRDSLTVTEVWRLLDPAVPAPDGPSRGTCAGQGRIGWPAHTLEILVEVREAADPQAAHAGPGIVGFAVAAGPTRTPALDRVVDGVRRIKALHDDVDIDTTFPPPQRLSETRRLADLTL
jgi:phage tail P2-like protein